MFKCREYDHFADNCPYSDMEGESDQIQQLYNLDESETTLQILVPDTYEDLIRTCSDEAIDHLHLLEVGMAPPHFCLLT